MDYIGFDKEKHFDGFSFYCGDCMELLKQTPDKYYDLCIVDPPYGIGIDGQKECVCKNPKHNRKQHEQKEWDKNTPSREYFVQLERVSKNQIIWGANYFVGNLTKGTKGWVVWYKGQQGLTMSDCELAYSSFDCPTRVVTINRAELAKQKTMHPTEKPIVLYSWLIQKYSKKGYKILDTHLGSASIALAIDKANKADGMELDFVGIELDKDYFNSAMKRFSEGRQQMFLNLNVE